eukprot:2713337-Rhodomonas_salina.2
MSTALPSLTLRSDSNETNVSTGYCAANAAKLCSAPDGEALSMSAHIANAAEPISAHIATRGSQGHHVTHAQTIGGRATLRP